MLAAEQEDFEVSLVFDSVPKDLLADDLSGSGDVGGGGEGAGETVFRRLIPASEAVQKQVVPLLLPNQLPVDVLNVS